MLNHFFSREKLATLLFLQVFDYLKKSQRLHKQATHAARGVKAWTIL